MWSPIHVVLTRTVPTELVPVDPASAAPINMDVAINPVCIILATTVPVEPVPVDSTLISLKPVSCDIGTDPARIAITKSVPADPMPVDPVLVSYIEITSAPANSTHVTALVNPILADPDPDALGALVYPVCITPLTPVHDDPVSVMLANSEYSVVATLIGCLLTAFFSYKTQLLDFHIGLGFGLYFLRKDLVRRGGVLHMNEELCTLHATRLSWYFHR
jgi:hypothetical protein